MAAAVATWLLRDARWSLAALIHFVPATVWLADNAATMHAAGITYWVVVTAITLAITAGGMRSRRRLGV
jgi:hypothetical protein